MNILKCIDTYGLGNDCNIYLIDGELLVDTGTGLNFQEIKNDMRSKHDSIGVKCIVNTHCHFDHTGGNKKFRDWFGCVLAVHEKDKSALETGSGTLASMFGETARTVTADKTLRNGSIIKTKNFSFQVVHTPGHTPGSICLYEKNYRILVSGDTLFDGAAGRTDLPGGDKVSLVNSLKKLDMLPISYLLSGHGPIRVGGANFVIKQLLNSLGNDSYMEAIK